MGTCRSASSLMQSNSRESIKEFNHLVWQAVKHVSQNCRCFLLLVQGRGCEDFDGMCCVDFRRPTAATCYQNLRKFQPFLASIHSIGSVVCLLLPWLLSCLQGPCGTWQTWYQLFKNKKGKLQNCTEQRQWVILTVIICLSWFFICSVAQALFFLVRFQRFFCATGRGRCRSGLETRTTRGNRSAEGSVLELVQTTINNMMGHGYRAQGSGRRMAPRKGNTLLLIAGS